VPHFTEDSLQRIINPFYAITVAPQLTREHEPPMSETAWVQANASLMGEMGSERWLRQLLDVLEGKVGAPEGPINPSQAVNIDPLFAAEHPPLIERDMWVDVNVTAVSRRLSPQNEPAAKPGRVHMRGKCHEHVWHIFSAWDGRVNRRDIR
jgi:hypothetical protein